MYKDVTTAINNLPEYLKSYLNWQSMILSYSPKVLPELFGNKKSYILAKLQWMSENIKSDGDGYKRFLIIWDYNKMKWDFAIAGSSNPLSVLFTRDVIEQIVDFMLPELKQFEGDLIK
jgi:hypothetical protein